MTESLHVHPVAAPLCSIACKLFIVSSFRNETKLHKVIARDVADDATMRIAAVICQEEKHKNIHKYETMLLTARAQNNTQVEANIKYDLTMHFVARSRMRQKVGAEPEYVPAQCTK